MTTALQRWAICVLTLLMSAGSSLAATLHVPQTYQTISQALAAARSGDTVLVAPGIYREAIAWPNVDGIRLIASDGPQATVIDAMGTARVVVFPRTITSRTLLRGFTITGGYYRVPGQGGGGIYCAGSPVIEGCMIVGNTVETQWNNYGGGIFVDGSPRIVGNLIQGNSLMNGSRGFGAGIYASLFSSPEILSNQIIGNTSSGGTSGAGGGIYTSGMNTVIAGNIIAQNYSQGTYSNQGGGIFVDRGVMAGTSTRIINNTIADNRSRTANTSQGGGICLFANALVANNIIVNNFASNGGGVMAMPNLSVTLQRNNVWQNPLGDYTGALPDASSLSVDPRLDATYRLLPTSPMIDQGTPGQLPSAVAMDAEGDARILDGDASPGAAIDLGGDEFSLVRLTASGAPQVGGSIQFAVAGPTGTAWSLYLGSIKANVVVQPVGSVLLGGAIALSASGSAPGNVPLAIPSAPALIGQTVLAQGIVVLGTTPSLTAQTTGRLAFTFRP